MKMSQLRKSLKGFHPKSEVTFEDGGIQVYPYMPKSVGRPRKCRVETVHALRKKGLSQNKIAAELGVTRSPIQYALKQEETP